ncbi:hypothetical protein NYE69_26135 [Paenibacillus sp. FSL R5-0527]|uniref:hypothetical protein n=1 Tax=Paenibacillus sp. FSL R5-0527 TaxID=2975321 RepID=UPI00097AE337|nr:hypothetical protein BK140_10255 [Paenibacillus macerans]
MVGNGVSQAGKILALDSFQPLLWLPSKEACNPDELPALIRQSLEDCRDIELDAKSTDDFSLLEDQFSKIMKQLKDSLTVSQYEQLQIWCKVNQDNMSRRYEGVYLAGARIGIKFAKQCESIG